MRRVLTATLLAFGIAASGIAGAQAKSGDAGNMAARGASTVVGTVVGMPISVVKSQYKDITDFTRNMVGDSHNPLLWALAVTLSVPCGTMNGLMTGIAYAPMNAWKYSAETPFSAETFSLGKAE